MSQEAIISNTEVSFKDFLFKNKRNRTILWIAAAAIVIQFSVFKYFYPFANFIHGDSFAYLDAAYDNVSINTYPIGYSKFLRLFNIFFKSDFALVTFQFLFIQFSILFFLSTIFYFLKPSFIFQNILLFFFIFNPLLLHLGNLVSSDGYFLGLSFTWFSLLLWIIYKPSNKLIILHAIVLLITFTVRYNALIYPIIAGIAFGLARLSLIKKLLGMGLSLILCFFFISFTTYQYKKLTNYWQFSPFSGWQIANNAMYAYRYVDSTQRKAVSPKYYALDSLIKKYFSLTRDTSLYPFEKIQASTIYMWSPGMPLMNYRNKLFKNDTTSREFKKWATMGPLYKEYGLHIIKKYPNEFIRYFIWPNANKYYAPPIEFLETYNTGKDNVTEKTKDWFGYKSRKIKTRFKNPTVITLSFYPILTGIINVLMLFSLISYFILKGWQSSPIANKAILLSGFTWLINAGFTIIASSPALRFQSFPILLTVTFVALLLDWLIKESTKKEINVPQIHQKLNEVSLAAEA